MSEQGVTAPARGHGRKRRSRVAAASSVNFYREVIEAGEAGTLASAGAADLHDELAMLRLIVRRHLAERPENLELTLKALHLLVRMTVAQQRLTGADAAQFQQQAGAVIEQFASAFFAEEASHGGEAGPLA